MNSKNQSSKHAVINLIKILKEQIVLNGNMSCQHQDLEKNLKLGKMEVQSALKMGKNLKGENVLVKLIKTLD